MTYSYQNQLNYNPNNYPLNYDGQPYPKPSSVPAGLAGAFVGGVAGGTIGLMRKHNPFKNGEIPDSFVKETFDTYIKNTPDAGKKGYTQGQEILKKIDGIKNPEELKTLFESNKEGAKEICAELKQSEDKFLNNITEKNLNNNKQTIKDKIIAGNKLRLQNMKNQIQASWDSKAKKFIKVDTVEDDVYKILKKTNNSVKGKKIAKYAAIGAVTTGLLGFVTHKYLANKQ